MFSYSTNEDASLAKTINSIIRYNDGVWKSAKQAKFLKTTFGRADADNIKNYFGIDLPAGCFLLTVDGYAIFSSYGGNGNRPVTRMYVCDDLGVLSTFKLKYVGSMREGTAPDPNGTILEYVRPPTAMVPMADEEQVSQWLGELGQKITLTAKIMSSKYCGQTRFGAMFLTVLKTEEGNLIKTFSQPAGINEDCKGSEVEFTCIIKDHGEWHGVKDTMVKNVKLTAQSLLRLKMENQ